MTQTTITFGFVRQAEQSHPDSMMAAVIAQMEQTLGSSFRQAAIKALGNRVSVEGTSREVSISGSVESLQRALRIKVAPHNVVIEFRPEDTSEPVELFIIPSNQYTFISGLEHLLDMAKVWG